MIDITYFGFDNHTPTANTKSEQGTMTSSSIERNTYGYRDKYGIKDLKLVKSYGGDGVTRLRIPLFSSPMLV